MPQHPECAHDLMDWQLHIFHMQCNFELFATNTPTPNVFACISQSRYRCINRMQHGNEITFGKKHVVQTEMAAEKSQKAKRNLQNDISHETAHRFE